MPALLSKLNPRNVMVVGCAGAAAGIILAYQKSGRKT